MPQPQAQAAASEYAELRHQASGRTSLPTPAVGVVSALLQQWMAGKLQPRALAIEIDPTQLWTMRLLRPSM